MENKSKLTALTIILTGLLLTACQNQPSPLSENIPLKQTKMKITSPNFTNNALIPPQYTCQGENISPQLDFSEVPGESKSLALIVEDPDAPNGNWVHWVVWNIPADTTSIPENVGPKFAVQGNNSSPKAAYEGPCPPSGTHRYFFKLYALSHELDLPAGSTRDQLLKEMEGRIIDQAQLMGTYRKT